MSLTPCRSHRLLRVLSGLALCLALALPAWLHGQVQRPLPVNVQRGILTAPLVFPYALIDERQTRLAPGARIHGESNLIMMPASVSGTHEVAFVRDASGAVSELWLLTPDEVQALPRKK